MIILNNLNRLISLIDERTEIQKKIDSFTLNNKDIILAEIANKISNVLIYKNFDCLYITCAYPYAFYDDSVDTVSNEQDVEIDWDESFDRFTSEMNEEEFNKKADEVIDTLGDSFFDILTFLITDSAFVVKKDGTFEVEELPESHFTCW